MIATRQNQWSNHISGHKVAASLAIRKATAVTGSLAVRSPVTWLLSKVLSEIEPLAGSVVVKLFDRRVGSNLRSIWTRWLLQLLSEMEPLHHSYLRSQGGCFKFYQSWNHCTMCTLYSFFSFRPSAVGHIVQPRDCHIIEHIFVPTHSVERNNEKIRFP